MEDEMETSRAKAAVKAANKMIEIAIEKAEEIQLAGNESTESIIEASQDRRVRRAVRFVERLNRMFHKAFPFSFLNGEDTDGFSACEAISGLEDKLEFIGEIPWNRSPMKQFYSSR